MPNTVRREKTFNIAADRLLFSGHNAGVDGDIHIDMADNSGKIICGSNFAVMDDKKVLLRNIYDLAGNEVFELANNKVTVKYANGIDCDNKVLANVNVDSGTVDGISTLSFQNGATVSFAGATNGIDFGNNTITNFNLPAASLEPNSIGSNNGFSTLEAELDQNRTETLTALGRTQAPHLSVNRILVSNGSGLLTSGGFAPSEIVRTANVDQTIEGDKTFLDTCSAATFRKLVSPNTYETLGFSHLGGALTESQIPSLSASKITSGTFDDARIPGLPASRIDEGAFHEDRIPPLPAARINSGTLDVARIPDLAAAKITSGTLDVARVPDLAAAKITSGTFVDARIPSLPTSKITSGTFDVARIPDLAATKITSGTLDASRIPDLDGTKITTGTISDARLNSNILRNNFNNQTLSANGFTIDAGNSGDAVLTLKADGDNNNEGDNAFIDFLQDGGTLGTQTGTRGRIGLDGLNNMFCGITTDSFFFGGLELRTHGSGTGNNYKPVSIKAHNTHTVNLDHLGINILSGYNLRFNGSNIAFSHLDGVAAASQIPSLATSKITSGTFDDARIPNLATSKITSGTFDVARLPDLATDKITSGTFDDARIPNLAAAKITSGTFDTARIPNLATSKITSGTFGDARIPDLATSKITSGTFDVARIPDLAADKITSGTFDSARIPTLSVSNIPDLPTSKITSGTFDVARIPDLATSKITSGTFDVARVPDLAAGKITSGTFDVARIPDLAAGKIATGTFDVGRIPDLAAGKIATGTFDVGRIPDLPASKIASGTIVDARLNSNILRNNANITATTTSSTLLQLTTNNDNANVTPFIQLVKNQADGTNVVKSSIIQYHTHLQFHPINHTKFVFSSVEFDDNNIVIPSNKKFKVGSNDLNFSHLAGSITDGQLPTTVLHSDEHVNIASGKQFQIDSAPLNFSHLAGSVTDGQLPNTVLHSDEHVNIASNKQFQINSAPLNFSHLAGSVTDGQLPTTVLHSDEHVNIASGKQFQIDSAALNFSHLAGSVTDGQLPNTVLHSDEHVNIASGKQFQIDSQQLGFNHLRSGSVATDSQLPTNRLKTNDADQTISQSSSNGTHLRIRHASNLSVGGGADNPNIHLEDADAVGNVVHRGTIGLNHAHDDIVIANSDADGGVAFFNNGSTFLARLDNDGLNLKSGLTYKVNGTDIGVLTTGAQGIQGVKTFADKPIFSNGIKSDDDTTLGDTTGNPLTTINGSVTLNATLTQSAGKTTTLQETNINGDLFVNDDLIQASGKSISTDTVTTKTVTTSRIRFNDDDHADTTTLPIIEDFQDSLIFDAGSGERHEFKVNGSKFFRVMSDGIHVMNGSVDRIHLKHTGELLCHKADNGATLQLENGQLSNPTGGESQISFSFNGNTTFRHFIRSRHASGNAGNSLDFLINQQDANADLNDAGCEEVFRIRQDSIDCLKPILNNAGVGQYGRFLTTMNMGESFIDSTKVLKMSVAMYRLNSLPSNPERFVRLDDGGGNTDTFTGLGKSIGEAYTSNPSAIIVNHTSSNDMNNSSHTNSALHVVRYGNSGNDPFGASFNDGQNTVVTGRGYLFKKATGTNPFETAVKNADRTLWQVRTKTDDDFKLTVNGESIQVYQYANSDNITNNALFYKNSIFEMHGDFAFIEYKNINGSGGAYVNLVFQCLGTI